MSIAQNTSPDFVEQQIERALKNSASGAGERADENLFHGFMIYKDFLKNSMKQQTFSPEQIEQMIQREYAVLVSPTSSGVQIAVASQKMQQFVKMRSPEKVAAMELTMGLRGAV